MSRIGAVLLVAIVLSFSGVGCGKSDTTVTTQLMKISAQNSAVVNGRIESQEFALAIGDKSTDDIFVDSYKMVISDIALSPGTALTGSNSTPVYNCPGATDEACMVDLATAGAVENLLTSGNTGVVKPDTFTFATVGTCKDNSQSLTTQGSNIYVKARAKLNGTWWYTTADMGVTSFPDGSGFNSVIKSVATSSPDILKIVTYGGQTSTDVIDDKPGAFNTTGFSLLPTAGAFQDFQWTDGDGNARTSRMTRIQ